MKKLLVALWVLMIFSCDEGIDGPVIENEFPNQNITSDNFLDEGLNMTIMESMEFIQMNSESFNFQDIEGSSSPLNSISFSIDGYDDIIPINFCYQDGEYVSIVGTRSMSNGEWHVASFSSFIVFNFDNESIYTDAAVYIVNDQGNLIQVLGVAGGERDDLDDRYFESYYYQYTDDCDNTNTGISCEWQLDVDPIRPIFTMSVNGGC